MPVLDHDAKVLHHLYSFFRKGFRDRIVPNAQLKPNRFRPFRKDIFRVLRDVVRPPENVNKVNLAGNIDEAAINGLPQDFLNLRVIDRNRNYFIIRPSHIFRNIKGWLAEMGFRLDAEHRDPFCFSKKIRYLVVRREDISFPAHRYLL